MKLPLRVLGAIAFASFFAAPAWAAPFSFDCISDNSGADCAILESQLTVDFVDSTYDGFDVDVIFRNTGSLASSITDVYFDDDLRYRLNPETLEVQATAGVSFTAGNDKSSCSPSSLPGGKAYQFSSDYCGDSDDPVSANGVNPGESLVISFGLMQGDFAGLIQAIEDGLFRVGIHVQAFDGGGSESGLIGDGAGNPPVVLPVPEPATLLLAGSGFAVIARLARRKQRQAHRAAPAAIG